MLHAGLVVLAGGVDVWAQEPFETLRISLGGTVNVNRTSFNTYWDGGRGGEGVVATPFYVGAAEVGVALHRYAPATDVPTFTGVFAFMGWEGALPLASRLHLYGGARLGLYRMRFEDEPGIESEMTLAPRAGLRLEMTPAWSLYAETSYAYVFTRIRLHLAYGSVGASYHLRTPSWLVHILR